MSLIHRLLARISRQAGLHRTRRRRPFSPFGIQAAQVETLENRTLLSAYVVGSLTDTGTGSGLTGDLRYCINNATSGNDTITFAQGLTGAIDLGSTLTLNASVDIQGPGANLLTVEPKDAPGNFNIFGPFFAVGSTASVEISGLTISGKNEITGDLGNGGIANNGTLTVSACIFSDNSNIYGGAISNYGTAIVSNSTLNGNNSGVGGAIFNSGVLTLNSSTIEANYLNAYVNVGLLGDANGRGGAIFNQGALTIHKSTLAHNSAQGGTAPNDGYLGDGMGGGIYMSAGTLSINSSTLSDNRAQGGDVDRTDDSDSPGNGKGGGLFIAGGTVSINNSTIAYNQAIPGVFANGNTTAYSDGGGICNFAGPGALQMYDTIVADNSVYSGASDLARGVTSLGHNLIGNAAGGSGFVASDLVNVNPQLGPLQNNGGLTQTMALLAGSPAIDAGDNANAPAYDQRGPGFVRVFNGAIDIGAFEAQPVSATQTASLAVRGFPSSIQAGVSASVTVTALKADGTIDTGYTGTVHFTSSDAKAVLPANYTFRAADAGRHTFSATLKKAGTQSITAADTQRSAISGTEGGILVRPAAASQFIISAPSSVRSGVAFSLTVTVEDAYGNVVTGYTGTVRFSSTDNQAKLPSNYTFTTADKGVHTFVGLVLRKKGTQRITITDTLSSLRTASVTVNVR